MRTSRARAGIRKSRRWVEKGLDRSTIYFELGKRIVREAAGIFAGRFSRSFDVDRRVLVIVLDAWLWGRGMATRFRLLGIPGALVARQGTDHDVDTASN